MSQTKSTRYPSAIGLARGDKGESVNELQDYLKRFGYLANQRDDDPYAAVRAALGEP